jgi:hypothetical protein
MARKQKNCSNWQRALLITRVLALCACWAVACRAQTAPGAVLDRYRQFLHPVFTAADVHHVRGVEIDREDLHLVLTDGVIGLMQAVDGHVTGAFFEGEGQILLLPPDRAERTSLALFTHSGILDTQFQTAYLRFFDDKLTQALMSGLRPQSDPQPYVDRWQPIAESLGSMDSLELLQASTNSSGPSPPMLHLRLAGTALGTFDVYFDTNIPEQIQVAQPAQANHADFYDIWTSFPMRSAREVEKAGSTGSAAYASDFRLNVKLSPPTDLAGEAELAITARRPGQRTLILELSRYLKVTEAKMNGLPAVVIQNEAVSGSELARKGDDLVAVVLPAELPVDHPAKLTLKYSGPVMFNAGGDLVYVGARGTWYPHPGPSFANFDLTFEYPSGWTLAATGRRLSLSTQDGVQTARFVSDKPIPHAGFNLGRFDTASATSKNVAIEAYAAQNVEKSLMEAEARTEVHPDPAKEVQNIADKAAMAVDFLSRELGPFPYSHLEISQLPGQLSQSWPGLIYLSSMAFLTSAERSALGFHDPFVELLTSDLMLDHEIAHQWWGDAVAWESYRDQWIIEAVANYCAAMRLESQDPAKMRRVLDHYREQLLKPENSGILADAGPVTLGPRLTSSLFPDAYDIVLYGRGTWLVHMLRTMLRQASGQNNDDTVFFQALRNLLSKSAGRKISTRDLQAAFEQVLPPSLFYDGQKSLDWFFDSWVNGASIPKFTLEGVHLSPAGSGVKVRGTIHEEFAAKDMVTAVPLYSVDVAGTSRFLAFVFVDEDKTEFELNAPAGTKQLLLDPENTILRR